MEHVVHVDGENHYIVARIGRVEVNIDPRIDQTLYFLDRIIAPSIDEIDFDEYVRRVSVQIGIPERYLRGDVDGEYGEDDAEIVEIVREMRRLVEALRSAY